MNLMIKIYIYIGISSINFYNLKRRIPENQIIYFTLPHSSMIHQIFNNALKYTLTSKDCVIYTGICEIFKNLNPENYIVQENRFYDISSGISESINVSMNQKSLKPERVYEFKENWIQDGLKYDINGPDRAI